MRVELAHVGGLCGHHRRTLFNLNAAYINSWLFFVTVQFVIFAVRNEKENRQLNLLSYYLCRIQSHMNKKDPKWSTIIELEFKRQFDIIFWFWLYISSIRCSERLYFSSLQTPCLTYCMFAEWTETMQLRGVSLGGLGGWELFDICGPCG